MTGGKARPHGLQLRRPRLRKPQLHRPQLHRPQLHWALLTHRVGGVAVRADVIGKPGAPPLLLVPGLGCASWMYRPLARALAARGHRVYLYDPPGHGWSASPRGPLTIVRLAAFLDGWLRAAGLAGVPAVGHSLGGEVLLTLAAERQGSLGPLALLAPTGIPDSPSVLAQSARFLLNLPLEHPRLWPRALAAYGRAGPLRIAEVAADQARHACGPLLPRVRQPVLLLNGGRDPVVRRWTVEAIHAALPDAALHTCPRGTHALMDSCRDEVAEAIAGFFSEHPVDGHCPARPRSAAPPVRPQ